MEASKRVAIKHTGRAVLFFPLTIDCVSPGNPDLPPMKAYPYGSGPALKTTE